VPLISVAVPVPFLDLLTYRVPDTMPAPVVGARVRVPVGTRVLTGVVVEADVAPSEFELKDVAAVLDREPYVPAAIVELCRWTADYYLAGVGDTIAVSLPPGAKATRVAFKTRRMAAVTPHGLEVVRLQRESIDIDGVEASGAGARALPGPRAPRPRGDR
jgi:primosomal protein N'